MIIKMNGTALQEAFQPIVQDSILLNSIPAIKTLPAVTPIDLPAIGGQFVEIGQEILIYGGMGMTVIAGLIMIVGLKKEGWKRLVSVLQGLGVGLIGPAAVALIAGFCLGIANLLS